MSDPLIDVLVAVFNGACTIKASLDSIQKQTIENIRIIVVDDGSTDNTLDILNAIAGEDDRVKIVPRPHGGIVTSLNYGLSICTAEFIARFDADDIAYPNRFSTQIDYLKTHPSCQAVSSAYIRIDENDRPVGDKRIPPPVEEADASWIPCREPFLMQTLLMVRKSALDAIHGYRLCEVSEDSDLYWRLNELGEMHNLDEVLGAYRLNANGISSKSIINGRRMAFWSQLVGISALRRKNGLIDIRFDKSRLSSYQQAVTLEEFCRMGSDELSKEELVRLKIASSVKLLQFASYRPFELDGSDCSFIRQSISDGDHLLSVENRKLIYGDITTTGFRLIRKGRVAEAYLLLQLRMPYVFVIGILRILVPKSIRPMLKKVIRRIVIR